MDKGLIIEDKYARDFKGLLRFESFESAEETITKLDRLYRNFEGQNDQRGIGYCRQVARLGKQRATGISKNPRVSADRRVQKEEIAQWFTIWLQTPDLFFDWLALRKASEDFKSRFRTP